jgi:probable LLM family oxidoreductase
MLNQACRGSQRMSMEIGIDSFAAAQLSEDKRTAVNSDQVIHHLIERIVLADQVGLDIFGLGEHHRKEFLDAAPSLILAAAAARTQRIRLTSAVSVLSADDPVRLFQQYATLDLISQGRAEMIVGRGSFIDAFPLFGYDLKDYDELFTEKLNLMLLIRDHERVTWKGRFRPALHDQAVIPRPMQARLPIWLGVGGTPESFVRAGSLGMPLMIAIIGGETHRFAPLVQLYRDAGAQAGFDPSQLKVGMHAFGYVAASTEQAKAEAFPGLFTAFEDIRKERGWPPMTQSQFDFQCAEKGAYLIGSPEEVAAKIVRHSKALGGLDRVTFQMDGMYVGQEKYMQAIRHIGQEVSPLVKAAIPSN